MNLQTMDRWFHRSGSVAFLAENETAMFASYMKTSLEATFWLSQRDAHGG